MPEKTSEQSSLAPAQTEKAEIRILPDGRRTVLIRADSLITLRELTERFRGVSGVRICCSNFPLPTGRG